MRNLYQKSKDDLTYQRVARLGCRLFLFSSRRCSESHCSQTYSMLGEDPSIAEKGKVACLSRSENPFNRGLIFSDTEEITVNSFLEQYSRFIPPTKEGMKIAARSFKFRRFLALIGLFLPLYGKNELTI